MGKKNFLSGLKSAGNWAKGAAEDTFKWGEKTAGNVGDRLLKHSETQLQSITGVFSSPSFLIVAGVVIVAVVLLKK